MSFLDFPNTIATKHIVPGITDLVFKSDPALAIARRDCLVRYEGGPSWQENFQYAMLNAGPYAPGQTADLSQRQLVTGATVTPRYYWAIAPAFLEKINVELTGPNAVFDYVDLLLQNAAQTLSARLAVDLYKWGQNVGSDRTLAINGLEEALNDGTNTGPSGNTFASYLTLTRNDANIGSALNSPMTGPTANVNGAISYDVLEEGWNSVVIGPERPNLMITTNKGMSYVKMCFQPQQRFESTISDFGFTTIKFNGTDIVQSQYAPGTRTPSTDETNVLGISALAGETLWYLNTKFLRFYVSTNSLYGFGFTGFLPSQADTTVVGRYHFSGNVTYRGPQYARVLFGITSAV